MKRASKTVLATAVSLVAFAANSLLARAALIDELADPVTFTAMRLASAAVALALLARLSGRRPDGPPPVAGSWRSAIALFGYAIGFSWAYLSLGAGTGALVLFAAVQITMIGAGLAAGERPTPITWLGLVTASIGLIYLVSPGLTAPDPLGTALMTVAGVCWGVYSLRGREKTSPLRATAGNFAKATPLGLGLLAIVWWAGSPAITPVGTALAIGSGVVTSGLGYVVWYAALGGLSATVAAIVQLLVPVLAALGGIVFLAERATQRLAIAGLMILGGVALAILGRQRRRAGQ